MSSLKPVMVLFAIVWLSACANTGPATSFNDKFVTEIRGDGTKFFTYVRRFHKGPEGESHHHDARHDDTALRKAVQAKLDTTGYCSDDYLTLEDYEANGIARIHGECRDGASDNDRKQFPNRP
jgi:hypothetical protein